MPLCPQITNTPITVTLTADFTVTNVVPVLAANTEQLDAVAAAAAAADAEAVAATAAAAAAAATAGAAQSTANTALANAATAYTAAIGSLQPSANTIVNASNQMTAIAANGITVYSGSSASSGARVVLNSTGLAGFNSGGTATFSVDSSTGAAVFAGSVTGATITGGTLNINGNAIIDATGLLTATGATITGTINATGGYFGTTSNGFSISSTGLVAVGSGVIVGGQIQTSSGTEAVIMNGGSNALQFKANGSVVANMLPLVAGGSTYGLLMHYGSTADSSGGTFPQMYIGSTNISMNVKNGSLFRGIGISQSDVSITGPFVVNGTMTYPGIATGSGSTMVVVTTGSRVAYTTSSERFKDEIKSIVSVGWLNKVLQLRPITYKTAADFVINNEPNPTQVGFLAEDIAELENELSMVVNLDPLGDPFSISYDRLVPFLTLAIKELKAEIDQLKGA